MTGKFNIRVEIIVNKKVYEQISQPVDFTSSSDTYVQHLRDTQKLANAILTKVVCEEKPNNMITDDEDSADADDDEESDADEKPDSTAKRKSQTQKNSKKIRI